MTQPIKWSMPLGSGADVQDLPDDDLRYASFSKIFPQITQVPLSAGGVAPRRVDFNSLFKLLADNIYYYQNGGVFEYSDIADYEKGAIVRYNDSIYLCIQDNSSLNKHTPNDSAYWSQIPTYADLSDLMPTGVVLPFGGSTVPNGWLLANGAAASRSGKARLFSVYGTTFGAGDGSTTFNLPDLRDRYIIGVNTNALGTQIAEQLPGIYGLVGYFATYSADDLTSGAFSWLTSSDRCSLTTTAGGYRDLQFNATRSNSIYTADGKVYPLSLALNFIIKT